MTTIFSKYLDIIVHHSWTLNVNQKGTNFYVRDHCCTHTYNFTKMTDFPRLLLHTTLGP